MYESVDLTIAPNEKYDAVIRGELPGEDSPNTEEDYRERHPAPDAADRYVETIESAPTAEDIGEDPEELPTLSWADLSVASDADLVAKMATYFDGMAPDEETERLRAKLRLLDVEVYVDAQIAARAELRE